ncbi:SNW domain-containing protein 1 [Araneus ventricosus]|uniref:SNW domain-containing protein 1 n=1 Tax=Araneus ventricosus TaxID=182803 RepID=A0A4Y2CVU0_ARAVE|nr:SNW domain-containing protein 1 [Araneus ventricosus]
MSSLKTFLPPPAQTFNDRDKQQGWKKTVESSSRQLVVSSQAPPYGARKGWVPRSAEDFGDGGAFPEIPVAQYPLGLGKKKEKTNANNLPVQLDSQGRIKYDVIARQGHSKDRVVYHKFQDLLPSEVTNEDDSALQKPTEEEVKDTTEATRLALEKLTQTKISAAMPVRAAEKIGPVQYIRYTPSQQGFAYNSGAKQRLIRMVEVQKDPMEPPHFKINKKIPRAPPSPPAPVMHSPTRKVTVKEQQEWRIPPCISNWKNSKGYTIPLHMRLAADGRGLQQTHVNENFAKLAEALYVADRKAREAVEMRSQLEKKLAQKEKEKKEENLRKLAQQAREQRAGIRSQPAAEKDDEVRERESLRYERHKDRQRDRNIQRAAPDKRNKLEKQRERDISEQIALGMPNARPSNELQFDQRLFNSTKGMDSGFGEEEDYNVYDKPWRSQQAVSNNIYRPKGNADKDIYGEDFDKLLKTNRFVPDKEFAGTDRSGRREGPVQFEKQEEEDPFGLDKFLTEAKKASKRPTGNDYDRERSKRRKD